MLAIGLRVALLLLLGLAFAGYGWLAWVAAVAALFATWYARGVASPYLIYGLLFATVAVAAITGFPPLRHALFARALLPVLGKAMPPSASRWRPARCGGTRRSSRACPIGMSCCVSNASRSPCASKSSSTAR